MKRTCILVVTTCLLAGLQVGAVPGGEQALAFVRGLQEKGYADVAVDYLKWVKQQPSVPEDLADVFDLEMSRSLRGAANSAFNAEEAKQMTDEAQKCLDRFLKEKPDHPDAVSAMVSWGNFSMDQALQRLRVAQATTDKAQQAKFLAEARNLLLEARPRYRDAVVKFQQRLQKGLAATSSGKSGRGSRVKESKGGKAEAARLARLEIDWVDARFRVGLVDYYVGQTFADPKDADRAKTLKNAAEIFDDIWQAYRVNASGQVSLIGLTAHMWHGKVMEDLGDLQTAGDIYDEVLANAESGTGARQSNMESLFAQVAYFRFLIYKKKASPEEFAAEARAWLTQFRNYGRTDGYQGVILELAKAMLATAEKGADRTKLLGEAREMLIRAAKTPSSHQQEMHQLLGKLVKGAAGAKPEEVKGFEEAVALANQAATPEAKQWLAAVAYYGRAIEILPELEVGIPKPERVAEVREALNKCRLLGALELLTQDKYQESLDMASEVVRYVQEVAKELTLGPGAGEMAVRAAFGLYANAAADKRQAAQKRLETIAQYTIQKWPGKPEADGVRILLGQLRFNEGKLDEAIALYENVNPKSERYPVAMHWAGHTFWVRYLIERQKGSRADKQKMTQDRDSAFKRFTDSLELQRKQAPAGKAMPQQMIDTQLELAEVRLDRGDSKEATELYQPLVDAIQAAKPQGLDVATMRIFVGAVKAYVALGDLNKASQVGMTLAELGADNRQVNDALVQFASMLDGERKRAVQIADNPAADRKDADAAKARIPGLSDVLGKLVKKLSSREQLPAANMLYIAKCCSDVNLIDDARQQYQKFLDRVEKDQDFAKEAARFVTTARTQLIGLLRKQGNPEEAMKQVDELIKAYPNTLGPLMEKGLILQTWADRDTAKYEAATEHWTMLRNMLQASRSPKTKVQLYEVIYHLAECLVGHATKLAESDKPASKAKAVQAEQLLKSTITLYPSLGGKVSLAGDYQVLIEKAVVLQGRSVEKKAAPLAEPAKPAEAAK